LYPNRIIARPYPGGDWHRADRAQKEHAHVGSVASAAGGGQTEGCANVVKHATGADRFEVHLDVAEDRCAIEVLGSLIHCEKSFA
jgi:hypothetical protein